MSVGVRPTITAPGMESDYPPRRSGSMRPGAAFQGCDNPGATQSAARTPITMTPATPGTMTLHRWSITRPTATAFMTWREMIPRGSLQARLGFCAAGVGTSIRTTGVWQAGATIRRLSGTSS